MGSRKAEIEKIKKAGSKRRLRASRERLKGTARVSRGQALSRKKRTKSTAVYAVLFGMLLLVAAVSLAVIIPQIRDGWDQSGTGTGANTEAGTWNQSGGQHAPAGQVQPGGYSQQSGQAQALFREDESSAGTATAAPELIPAFAGEDSVILNGNRPNFTAYDLAHFSGEQYSELDRLDRCGPATALLHRSMMPKEERGSIGAVRPSGWQTAKYPDLIEDNYLYNRCHLIAYALTGQNENEKNLITGTRHMNASSMLSYELPVMQYLDASDNHVLYRVTPYFRGAEQVARGVEMEAFSVEDRGQGVCFHVFVYNWQPGIEINYLTGDSRRG